MRKALSFAFQSLRKPLWVRMGGLWVILALGLAWTLVPQTQGDALDDADTLAIMKANFLFHFAASNEWPDDVKTGPFRMAIIGDERLFQELSDKYAMKAIGAQVLEIFFIADLEELEKQGFFHVIYAAVPGDSLRQLASLIADRPVMLVAHDSDALANGALINFIAQNNRIRYAINAKEASRRGLLIGNRILSWAVQ